VLGGVSVTRTQKPDVAFPPLPSGTSTRLPTPIFPASVCGTQYVNAWVERPVEDDVGEEPRFGRAGGVSPLFLAGIEKGLGGVSFRSVLS